MKSSAPKLYIPGHHVDVRSLHISYLVLVKELLNKRVGNDLKPVSAEDVPHVLYIGDDDTKKEIQDAFLRSEFRLAQDKTQVVSFDPAAIDRVYGRGYCQARVYSLLKLQKMQQSA